MAQTKTKAPEQDQDTKERLLTAAAAVFAEKGFDGATVKEIVDRAGVNISLVSYHFNGKEGIFKASLEKFGRERLKMAETIFTAPESVEDMKAKLKLWVHQFLQCHVEESSVCEILHRENMLERPFMMDIFQSTFLKTFEAVVKFFETAQKKGIVRKTSDPTLAASLVFGSLIHLGRNQKIQEKIMGVSIRQPKYREHVAEQFVATLLHGIA